MGQTRTERKRAEKAANREAKAAKKTAHVVEEKKKRLSNGVLALMIFGVVALMFAVVWGYNYSQKEASLESYMTNHGGKDVYENMMITENQTLSVTAEKNDMKVTIDCTDKAEAKEYKGEDGEKQLKYIAAYYLGTMKPSVRGLSASAHCVVNLNDKEYTTVDVKWSEVEDILEENGIHLEDLQHDHDHEAEETTEE